MSEQTLAERRYPTDDDVLRISNEHVHAMCPACRELDRMGTMPPLALCLICAYVKPPALWSASLRAGVCADCRDARHALSAAEERIKAAETRVGDWKRSSEEWRDQKYAEGRRADRAESRLALADKMAEAVGALEKERAAAYLADDTGIPWDEYQAVLAAVAAYRRMIE